MEIAWIGTGIMGAPMALRLLRVGHRVRVFNRTPEKARALANDGAIVAADAAAAVAGAEVVFIMVSDTPDVEAVVTKAEPALKAGQLVIDMSTISPRAERALAARLKRLGVDYLDAPVSGGDVGAKEGTLTIMAGGEENAFERARPLFEHLGRRATYMGASGAGQMTKLANQIAVALALEAASEAIRFAQAGGLEPSRVLEAIGAGAAGSWQLANLGPKIIAGDYRPGFFIKLIRKDLRLVADAARESKVALPGLAMMASMFNSAAALGHDLDGTQAVAAVLDRLADVK
ncbi:MAG: NAD(P)-dependent oxidoreductase [Candidatus Binatus sp.]|uniref:NAD(P)-dependent oxidoreductase n=1 Tax=Candidatus Binatus sp. TaxID=2811406 RepID=UPI002727C938|nr:NAD(P)-dependent oxidoreductase [Candidatus Binatus sp.]MDO8432918.1 NAD(P)-dependent oxidoreductase [Candidatus Binatus sp.]